MIQAEGGWMGYDGFDSTRNDCCYGHKIRAGSLSVWRNFQLSESVDLQLLTYTYDKV